MVKRKDTQSDVRICLLDKLMKKLDMMRGLLAKPQQLAPGGMVNYSDPAQLTNNLSTGQYAPGIGLGVPEGMSPTGISAGVNYNTGITGMLPGAEQGMSQQQALSGMLMQQAQGQGPNPAQMMLNQATGKNVANTAALMAGQRGASANPALLARQAGMAGSSIQQNAAGQAATLGAEQQLAAQHQLAGLSAQQVAQQQTANQQNIGMQGNINTTNASLANSLIGNRGKQFGGTQQGMGAATAINGQGTGGGMTETSPNTAYNSNLTPTAGGIYASGGVIGPRSFLGQHLAKMAKGGIVPARVSPGEIYLPPAKAQAVAKGQASPAVGEKIRGKAKVKGDSLKNDTVDKNLEEGGVVVPRSKADDYDKAAAFVRAVMAKNKRR